MFSILYDTYFSLSMHFKMSSAISFNLDQSKIFSSGNGLIDWLHIFFASVRLRFLYCSFLSVKSFNIGHNLLIVSVRAFLFYIGIPCGKMFSLVPRSRSSVGVKYERSCFSKSGCYGISVSQALVLLCLYRCSHK